MAVTLDNTVSMPETHRYLWNIGDWFHLVGAVDGHLWNPQGTADVSPFSPTSTQQHHINTSPTCILMQIHSTFFYWKAANTTKTTASFPLISSSITGSIQCYKTTGWKTSIKRSILESEMVHNQEDFTKSKNKPPPKKNSLTLTDSEDNTQQMWPVKNITWHTQTTAYFVLFMAPPVFGQSRQRGCMFRAQVRHNQLPSGMFWMP